MLRLKLWRSGGKRRTDSVLVDRAGLELSLRLRARRSVGAGCESEAKGVNGRAPSKQKSA